ncbi:hypothetical protein [Coraliomargarita parva]|uniref:hypothetical protein n=1 Tax=Coraliomargarita parva TaxID=3014050 RepID=UPI0022B5594A|nr:hypothetical protein [Coraliomargarita parva]
MKKYLALRMRIAAILMAAALGSFAFVAPQVADAQSTTDKIRLMAETLRARDSGDLLLAKDKAEELIKIAPNDENVQRLLASINRDLERQGGAPESAVFGQAADASPEAAMESPAAASMGSSSADSLAEAAAADQASKVAAAEAAMDEAEKLAELGAYSDATALLDSASASLTLNTATAQVLEDLEEAKGDVVLAQAEALAESGNNKGAEALLEDYFAAGGNSRKARSLAKKLDAAISDPYSISIAEVSPEFVEQSKIVRDLLTRGRAQYLNGDYDAAASTFKEVEARDANNAEAKAFSTKIAEVLGKIHKQNHYKTREQMLTEVDQGWERPKVFDIATGPTQEVINVDLKKKMENIIIPQVNFSSMELTRVIETLSELSVEYDAERKGVNIVPLFDPNQRNPRVNITLRNLNLDRILGFVTAQVNFAYDVGTDAVTVSPDGQGTSGNTVTEFFPISRATIIRITGGDSGGASAGPVDPFAPAPAGGGGGSADDRTEKIKSFFQSAGVDFTIPGANLAFDGEQLIATQTRRNLDRMRTILRNYSDVKQVEIEAKFLEVSQNDLDELGFNWNVSDEDGNAIFTFGGQSLAERYSVAGESSNISISSPATAILNSDGDVIGVSAAIDKDLALLPPSLPTQIDLAAEVGNLATATGWSVLGYDVDFALRALARKSGSDLMSAPKVTVLSGKRANITVAQELRYPESYGDIESTVSSNNSGGAAISITAGTPEDFVTRNVGVEMSVTPNVENDDTISLILEPRVTEFEGFVEYGGPSVALAGSTIATVPAGFYQPIFSTREISTEVTVFDGATVVMGGLTRDEVKSIDDRVPVLGDIPGVGRLFRSEGETRQKRNLLIFVTANLVSPGGSPAKQSYRNVGANELFQNPTIMTPSGSVNRGIKSAEAE